MAQGNILVVDDDRAVRLVLGALLEQAGYRVVQAESAERALAAVAEGRFDLCITDLRMPSMDGLTLLDRIHDRSDMPVVVLTAHGTVPLAVDAMRRGAADFLLKPFEREDVLFVVARSLEVSKHSRGHALPGAELVGSSPKMEEVRDLVRRVAVTRSTVLVRGESGTGKELVARMLHEQSPRADGPFIKVHCAALPESLLESELFGYEKGAFTGAIARKPGRVELAQGGTLFLDEIGDITPATQVKLLRVLQEREFERLGGRETLKADVRFVAATHRDLEGLVASGDFREDLFYRLSVVPIWLPALRERADDVRRLVTYFFERALVEADRDVTLDPRALERLSIEEWPGNVRQLANFVERLVVLTPGAVIRVEDVERELARNAVAPGPRAGGAGEPAASLLSRRRAAERDAVTSALERSGNNRTAAARMLGVSRRTLYKKLSALGMS
jgi:DNA-binding NtrC family response regulator